MSENSQSQGQSESPSGGATYKNSKQNYGCTDICVYGGGFKRIRWNFKIRFYFTFLFDLDFVTW